MIPAIACTIQMACPINLSEDPQKVQQAVSNIFPFCTINNENFTVKAQSKELRSFEKIYETISSYRSHKTYIRNMKNNLEGDTTWFLLNKQAAFAQRVAICEEPVESPMGPIKVTLTSSNIDGILDWLASAK